MDSLDESGNSLQYIDDTPTDDEISENNYNLQIIENYRQKNRNIQITNKVTDEATNNSLSPVAPLAEETEFSDSRQSDFQEEESCHHTKRITSAQNGMKLIVRGWQTTICIQGLDNKSSITFARRNQKMGLRKSAESRPKKSKPIKNNVKPADNKNVLEKTKKGRWKMLTRSLISKSARLEKRGLDERYPKYVLLKNEEEIISEKQSYPKMVVFHEEKRENAKLKENFETKSQLNFKKTFKNKTRPIDSTDKILRKTETDKIETKDENVGKGKKIISERSQKENKNFKIKKKITVESRSFVGEKLAPDLLEGNKSEIANKDTKQGLYQGHVFNEIQDIFEDALSFNSPKPPLESMTADEYSQEQCEECYSSVPPHFCRLSCHNSCFFTPNQPSMYIPVCSPHGKPLNYAKKVESQIKEEENLNVSEKQEEEKEFAFQNIPFGLLSGLFPRVVVLKAYTREDKSRMSETEKTEDVSAENNTTKRDEWYEEKTTTTLEVPPQNLTLKSKMVLEDTKVEPSFFSTDPNVNCLTINEIPSSDEEQKVQTDDSETTEYLQYYENDTPENNSGRPTVETPKTSKDSKRMIVDENHDDDENEDKEPYKNLTLTKIGYKMYDNLTKLSLNREKEITEKPETKRCGCDGSETKKSPYNVTLESNNRIVEVTVPENEMKFQLVNPEGTDIQIGLFNASAEKKIVKKSDLWHSDNGRELPVALNEKSTDSSSSLKGSQKIKLSLAKDKDVVLSIELNGREKSEEKIKDKLTKEIKVGTDDFDLVGGDFLCNSDRSNKNLSPRTGQLLKNLKQKLELGEKEKKFLVEKINEKLTDEKYRGGLFPGVFLVKQINPTTATTGILKKSLKIPFDKTLGKVSETKNTTGQLREYYCEECLATMRMFEDENPSVKSIVDKFETIIQLESY